MLALIYFFFMWHKNSTQSLHQSRLAKKNQSRIIHNLHNLLIQMELTVVVFIIRNPRLTQKHFNSPSLLMHRRSLESVISISFCYFVPLFRHRGFATFNSNRQALTESSVFEYFFFPISPMKMKFFFHETTNSIQLTEQT